MNSLDGNRIVKDAGWLQPLADPPSGVPISREGFCEALFAYVSGVFRCGRGRNLFIFGVPGSGKTVYVKHLLLALRKTAEDSRVPLGIAYVNCARTRTAYFTLVEVVKEFGATVPVCGVQEFRLKQAFESLLVDQAVVVCLDEVDGLPPKAREQLVYYLNRQPNTTLILVSNQLRDASAFGPRVLSTLQPVVLTMDPYTAEEAQTILKERVEQAFYPDTIKDKLLLEVAHVVAEKGDIRMGFAILLTAGYLAETQGHKELRLKDIQAAIRSETALELAQKVDALEQKLQALQRHRR